MPAGCVVTSAAVTCSGSLALGATLDVVIPGNSNTTTTGNAFSDTDANQFDNIVSCKFGIIVLNGAPDPLDRYDDSILLPGAEGSFSWTWLNASHWAWRVSCPQTGGPLVQLGLAAAPLGDPVVRGQGQHF